MRKTTLELPDDLMQQVKLRAVRNRQKLKDTVAQLLELGMAAVSAGDSQPSRAPKPVRLKGGVRLELENIQRAIADGRD